MKVLAQLEQLGDDAAPLVFAGAQRWTGAMLLQRSGALARQLDCLGARRVASLMDNGPSWLVLDLALQQRQLVHVPLPPFFHAGQIVYALRSAGVDVLISDRELPHFGTPTELTEAGLLAYPIPLATPVQLPAGTALVTFTSGTTAEPKGVCLSQAALDQVASSLIGLSQQTQARRHVCLLPLGVLLEQVAGMRCALLAGAELCLPALRETGLAGASSVDGTQLAACLRKYAAHSAILLPQMLDALCSAIEAGQPAPTTLRLIAVGGARVAPESMARARALGLPVFQGYGLSEAGSVVCVEAPAQCCAGSVGKPLPGRQISIDDQGQVWIENPGFLGYLGEPAWTGTVWPSGDLGHFDEQGFLHLHGRRSNVLITAFGRNVCPEWVESELQSHPLIAQAFVCGDAEAWLQAVLVPSSAAISNSQLERAVVEINRRLPDYARIGGIVRSALPFNQIQGLCTANGRLRRPALYEHFEAELGQLWDQSLAPMQRAVGEQDTHPRNQELEPHE